MTIKSIDALKKNINQSALIIFLVIFSFSIIGFYLIHDQFLQKSNLLNQKDIKSAIHVYKSNLSEKLSIIASSTVFLDYLRSGQETRNQLYSEFLYQLSSLKSKSISGMELINSKGISIFHYGISTSTFITINLCYLNQTLDSKMGECQFYWKLFFIKSQLINEILTINPSLKTCNNCSGYNLLNNKYLGSFKVKDFSNINLNLKMTNKIDYFFYSYLALMAITFIFFGIWNWHRLNNLLNTHITEPIKNLTKSLKLNSKLEIKNNIEEIKYLVGEINSWKSKLDQMKSDEHAIKLGKIAAQLAHDVRSPLSVIDMLVGDAADFPEERGIILRDALQRIEDISNNFLTQYKTPSLENKVTREFIPGLLESIVSEKRIQYRDRDIKLALVIDNEAEFSFALIDASDFKRVLSNLINNAIESISTLGYVAIHLFKLNNNLKIEISDNGCGIDEAILPKIRTGGTSVGKKNGSGLGLSHAMKKIEEWNGRFEINSQLGVGTQISIELLLID